VGLQVVDEHLIRHLTDYDGVRLQNSRVCLEPWLVEKHIADYRATRPAQEKKAPDSHIHLSAGCCAHHIVDLQTDEVRPITTADLIEATKLIDALHDEAVSGHVPGFPQDVPAALQALVEYKIGSEVSHWGGSFVAPCSIKGLEYIYEMHQVMAQSFGLPLYVVSPLRVVGDSLQAILHFLDRVDHLNASSMPIMGANAPVHFVGAFVQAMAESIGGFVVLRLLAPGVPVSFGIMAFCLDMRYGSITYGSPEQNLCDLIGLSIRAYYGMAGGSTRSIRTMAKRPGVQAAAEKGASAMVGALAGSRSFMGGGMLSVDEVFSPEQLIIDREIADYAGRVAQGFEFDQEKLSLEIIRECVDTADFLSHPSTLESFKSTYWMPRLFEHPMLEAWRQSGERDVREKARQMVSEKLRRYDFELGREKKETLNSIYQRAQETLA
jgi:trimethylamine:corrinoid methyltransferase-like protein